MKREKFEKTVPCKGCNKRTPTCHGECEAYLNWLKKHQYHAQKRKERINQSMRGVNYNTYRK